MCVRKGNSMTPYESSLAIHAALKERGIKIKAYSSFVLDAYREPLRVLGNCRGKEECPDYTSPANSLKALRALGCSLKLNGHEWSVATTDGRVYFENHGDDAFALFALLKKVLGVE